MRLLAIDNVKSGMKIARSIYSATGKVLLAEGVQLTANIIYRLKILLIPSKNLFYFHSFLCPKGYGC